MVDAATAITQVRWQDTSPHPWIRERAQGDYRKFTLIPGSTDIDVVVENPIGVMPLEIKCVLERHGKFSGQWISGHRDTLSPPEAVLDVTSEQRDYAVDSSHTFNPDIFVGRFFEERHLQYELLRDGFDILSSACPKATISPFQEPMVLDELSRRIAGMEEALLRFSELPENWDSYGGSAISVDAIDKARNILTRAINLNLPEPWVAPGGDAGIGIQWDTERVELYIDVVPDEETTYVLTPKVKDANETDGVLTKENLPGVLNQLAESTT